MDLSPAQRVLAFLGIVVVLGGIGAYLLIPGVRAAHGRGQHTAAPGHTAQASPPAPTVPPSTLAPSSPPAASPTPASPAPDIYAWLPFSQVDLAKAASVTEKFGAAYDTWSYTESASSYVAGMNGLITSQLRASLASGWAAPGDATPRTQQRQVSTGRAVINSLRSFGPSSLTFVVTISQALHTTKGKEQLSGQYAVTVVNTGGTWQVNDIELASAGNS